MSKKKDFGHKCVAVAASKWALFSLSHFFALIL